MNPPAAPSTRDAEDLPEEFLPDIDDLVTEDDIPVDNIFSEKQQRLLTEPLYSSRPRWPFVALANVGLFYRVHHPPLVPDMLLSLEVEVPEDVWSKSHRAYFVWEFGKPPDVVIDDGQQAQSARHRPGRASQPREVSYIVWVGRSPSSIPTRYCSILFLAVPLS